MKSKRLTLLLCFISSISNGQNIPFSPSGIMEISRFTIDTILKSNLTIPGNQIIFNRIDTSSISAFHNNNELLANYFRNEKKDTVEYFFLLNGTNRDIRVKRLSERLVALEIAQNNVGIYQPIQWFGFPKCGTGIDYSDLVISKGQTLIIKSNYKIIKGNTKSIGRVKLKTSTNGILISKSFVTYIDTNTFSVNSKHQKEYYLYGKRNMKTDL